MILFFHPSIGDVLSQSENTKFIGFDKLGKAIKEYKVGSLEIQNKLSEVLLSKKTSDKISEEISYLINTKKVAINSILDYYFQVVLSKDLKNALKMVDFYLNSRIVYYSDSMAGALSSIGDFIRDEEKKVIYLKMIDGNKQGYIEEFSKEKGRGFDDEDSNITFQIDRLISNILKSLDSTGKVTLEISYSSL